MFLTWRRCCCRSVLACEPCPIPEVDLTLTITRPDLGTQTNVMAFLGPGAWLTGCITVFGGEHSRWGFSCVGGIVTLTEHRYAATDCSGFPFLNQDWASGTTYLAEDTTCGPFHMHWQIPSAFGTMDLYVDE